MSSSSANQAGEMEKRGRKGDGVGGGLCTPMNTTGGGAPLVPSSLRHKGKAEPWGSSGEVVRLVVNLEFARKAIGGWAAPPAIRGEPEDHADKLRPSMWRLQGNATIQWVASNDGRFFLGFVVKGDRCFVLKAQLWHFKWGDVVSVAFDGQESPTDVDLGVIPYGLRCVDSHLRT